MMNKTNFVHVNLSAVTETTLESRIRGYVAGAFTDANRAGSAGWFEQADEGILFLDEFQSVPVPYQTQLLDLLHAVSDRVSVARMGQDGTPISSNVKVILAVNEEIHELLRSGRLRHDLFYRMRHLVRFPALHQRFADPQTNRLTLGILLKTYRWRLAPLITEVKAPHSFKADIAGDELTKSRLRSMFPIMEEAAIVRLLEYKWPGNLRELERVADDVFCDCDNNASEDPVIQRAQVDEAIDRFATAYLSLGPSAQPADAALNGARTLLDDVESALRAHGFVIESTLEQLKKTHPMYSLRSRRSLRLFLLENIEKLSVDIRTHRKMLRFMQIQGNARCGGAAGATKRGMASATP
jgi:transcriptional regulator with PAS, ATPase and Fis domain